MLMTNSDLAARWSRLRGEKPALRIRDAAASLGVSEAELVALGVGRTATPLGGDFRAILNEMPQVGRVMCLTRNEDCVHERHGRRSDHEQWPHITGDVLAERNDARAPTSVRRRERLCLTSRERREGRLRPRG